ncbi:hypothetical protein RRG08_045167 [Elysia crispata]|uniref:Uncharacterized protein n=1 Tax=Elysia crispata TaxID=231223 RepID=A0AAE1DXQ9_9GAST|nr:hypothetical protein RRG08_045167 [Elysia crispata]
MVEKANKDIAKTSPMLGLESSVCPSAEGCGADSPWFSTSSDVRDKQLRGGRRKRGRKDKDSGAIVL